MQGKLGKVVVAHKDRLCRFGFELIEFILCQSGAELMVLDKSELSPETELSKDLLNIIHVFSCRIPDLILDGETEVRYMLKFLASTLDGHNREEIFTIWTGTGRNGKGVLGDILAVALGVLSGYFHSIRASLLTSDAPNASSPVPEILNFKGKRLVMGSEPEKGSSIKSGMLKYLTGNDRISGRYLYQNTEISFYPQHSMVLQTNAIPKLDADDEAVWKRSRVIDFPNVFVDYPKKANERQINRLLKQEVKNWGPQFMLLLLEWYKVYLTDGLEQTPAMIAKANRTRAENDDMLMWSLEHFEVAETNIHTDVLKEHYENWFFAQHNRHVQMSSIQFHRKLEATCNVSLERQLNIGGKNHKGVRGLRLK
ncbi:hypothetical protein HDU81_004325 [Chytriomyces hyalinus]|nr:hypothetical protein HDU81_004325 [Chytriomyces hyalinus]